MSVEPIDIKKLESKTENIYQAVVVTAKRARQINDEMRIEYNQRLEPLSEKEVEDENVISKDKLNISLDFEKRKKPTELAIEELLEGKLEFRERSKE